MGVFLKTTNRWFSFRLRFPHFWQRVSHSLRYEHMIAELRGHGLMMDRDMWECERPVIEQWSCNQIHSESFKWEWAGGETEKSGLAKWMHLQVNTEKGAKKIQKDWTNFQQQSEEMMCFLTGWPAQWQGLTQGVCGKSIDFRKTVLGRVFHVSLQPARCS